MFDAIRELFIDVLRLFYNPQLPDELSLPEIDMIAFKAGFLRRSARLFRKMPNADPLLRMIGPEATEVAATARSPFLLYSMEYLSLGFHIVQKQCHRGVIVDEVDRRRLVILLSAFLKKSGLTLSDEESRDRVDTFIKENSLPDATPDDPALSPVTIDHPLWEALREFDAKLESERNDSLGLQHLWLQLVDPNSGEDRYDWCTPLNCRVFARTGCDGIHYSFLVDNDRITEDSPVVETLPADGGESNVVAASLREFLEKGLECGYGYLTDEISGDEMHREIASQLRDRFDLVPRAPRADTMALKKRFGDRLRLPPMVREDSSPKNI